MGSASAVELPLPIAIERVSATLALPSGVLIRAFAQASVVCVGNKPTTCINAPTGIPRSVALGPWMDSYVAVLEIADKEGWSWYYHLPHMEEWEVVMHSAAPLALTGIANPEGDSLQLLLTEIKRPVEGWLWFNICPGSGISGFLQRIDGPWTAGEPPSP